LGKKLETGTLNVPPNTPLVENALPMPYVIVGDEAFPLKTYLLRHTVNITKEEKKARKFTTIDCHQLEGLLRMRLVF
jgi:hypothetical protein